MPGYGNIRMDKGGVIDEIESPVRVNPGCEAGILFLHRESENCLNGKMGICANSQEKDESIRIDWSYNSRKFRLGD